MSSGFIAAASVTTVSRCRIAANDDGPLGEARIKHALDRNKKTVEIDVEDASRWSALDAESMRRAELRRAELGCSELGTKDGCHDVRPCTCA